MRRSVYAHSLERKRALVLSLEEIMGIPHGELREWSDGKPSIRLSLETCDRDGRLCDSKGNPS